MVEIAYAEYHRKQKERERTIRRRDRRRKYFREYHRKRYPLLSPEELIERQKQFGESRKGEKNPFFGKHQTEKAKRKLSEARKGSKNAAWKDGISLLTKRIRRSFEYRQWRSDVFTRDDFTCQECNRRGGYLHAHHVIAFSDILELNDIKMLEQTTHCEELWNINNGITLCKRCHELVTKERRVNKKCLGGI